MTARRIVLGLAGVVLCASAHAAVYVCEENGTKVFRDRPCGGAAPSATPSPAPAPAQPPTTGRWDDSMPVSMTINVFSQVVGLRLPARWKPGHQTVKPLFYRAEFVPSAENVNAWSEMITVLGHRDLASRATPRAFIQNLAELFAKTCPAHYVAEFLGEASIDSYPAYIAILGCARYLAPTVGAKAGQGEVAVIAAIQGTRDMYSVQRAVRGDRFDGSKAPINAENAADMLKALEIRICEPGETNCGTRKPRAEPARTRPPSSPRPGREARAGAAPPPG